MSPYADHKTPSLFEALDTGACGEVVPSRLLESGVAYIPAFLTSDECKVLLARIDAKPWINDLKRRAQHYGWRYSYSSRFVTDEMKAEPLPDFILEIATALKKHGWFESVPDQVIVNEYEPGQGIAHHVDRACFGPTVATLSPDAIRSRSD